MIQDLALALVLSAAATAAAAQQPQLYSFGAGDLDGGYYAAARALCARVSRGPDAPRCSPEATPGSLYNLEALRDRQLDFALVQSDWHRHAYNGTASFAESGPMTELRSVMSLYPETVTLLSRAGAEIGSVDDLRGKKIDVGQPGSGRSATARDLLDAAGYGPDDFAAVYEMTTGSAVAELCAGRIDATVLVVGHPNAAVARAINSCDAQIVPITGSGIEALVAANPDLQLSSVPREAYRDLDADVPGIAVTATVVTRADMSPSIVGGLVAETLSGLDPLALAAPILEGLDPERMREAGLTAPLHPAAEAAFDAFLSPASN